MPVMAGPDDEREKRDGRFEYTDRDFLDAIRAEGGMCGTQDVADRVECSYEAAYKRLRALEDEGRVNCDRVGNARLWQVIDDGS